MISVDGQVLYSEVEFCLVEFAVQVLQWLQRAKATDQDFSYSSVESERPGLVWIVERNGKWQIGSICQEYSEEGLFTLDEIFAAVEAYVNKLKHRDRLGPITEVTDESGVIVERYEYDVYGAVTIFGGSGITLTDLPTSPIGGP